VGDFGWPSGTIAIIFFSTRMFNACSLNDLDQTECVINENSIVIDVRTEKEYKAGHLKMAVNIPYDTIKDAISNHVPDRDAETILYCRSGRRSGIAKKILDEMGYTRAINAGGYKELKIQENKQLKE